MPKLNVLCLHGFRTNGDIMKWQAKPLVKALEQHCEFLWLDSPVIGTGKVDELVAAFFEPPYREWANCNEETQHYDHLKENIKFIESRVMQKFYGQVDGIIGFSQGAMMGGLLCAKSFKDKHPLWTNLKFFLSFAGYEARDPEWADYYKIEPMKIPSLHVYGKLDEEFRERSIKFLERFEAGPKRLVFEHEEGHKFPGAAADMYIYERISTFVQGFKPRGLF